MDPQQRLLLQAAWRALEDATLDPRSVAGSDTGVFVGVMANEWANLHMSDYAGITAQHGSGNGYFMTANRLSYHLDLKGPSMAVDTACSSSLVAVHLACAALRSGECDQSPGRRRQPHPDPGAEHLLHAGRAVGPGRELQAVQRRRRRHRARRGRRPCSCCAGWPTRRPTGCRSTR